MLNIFLSMFALLLMLLAFFGLYLSSEKQLKFMQQHIRWQQWVPYRIHLKYGCFVLCGLSMLCFAGVYGFSIAIVIWWVLASPVLLGLIVWFNRPIKK